MSSYVSNHVHFVFGTKERRRLIPTEVQPRLWAYTAGIARNHRMRPVAIGGIDDHIHVLLEVPPTLSIAKAVQLLKANSSKWMNEQDRGFAWQEKYAAFSVSRSNLGSVANYINRQAEHHKKRDFKSEFAALLRKHGIALESRFD